MSPAHPAVVEQVKLDVRAVGMGRENPSLSGVVLDVIESNIFFRAGDDEHHRLGDPVEQRTEASRRDVPRQQPHPMDEA